MLCTGGKARISLSTVRAQPVQRIMRMQCMWRIGYRMVLCCHANVNLPDVI